MILVGPAPFVPLGRLLIFSLIIGLALPGVRAASPTAEAHPIAAPGNFELHPDLELSLFAREPDVVDPVALTFDEEGRVYVVEMRDYPYGFGPDRKPGGVIRLLEDLDGDGKVDRSTVFATNLSFPTSIAPWNGGVVVTAPPEVIFLKDTDRDGRADVREVLLKRFTLGVTDSNLNGLRWGLDNRLHGVNGGNGGNVISTRRPGPGLPLRNLDFSFNPATGDFSPTFHTSGGFGLVFDDWGRSFVTYNINHLQQRILAVRYLNRFPGFPPLDATTSISDHGEMARVFPVSEPETRVNHPEQAGHFSSAGGMGYLGCAGYPGDLTGSLFVCDVVGNLVHRDVLEPAGPIFAARRAASEQAREFFASRDPAFRPVGLELGPDGALYLIDMQRDVIEHPDYIPQKVKEKLDLRAGQDRGRIYRIAPRGGRRFVAPALRQTPGLRLVGLLGHSNQWWRLTAQRLLVERGDRSVVHPLREMARGSNPLGRLHALWTLQGLGALAEPLVLEALADRHPGLRENALLLAEPFLTNSTRLQQRIPALAGDVDPRVRCQAALTLGQLPPVLARSGLQRIFVADHRQLWTRLAVLSSLRDGEDQFLSAILDDPRFRDATSDEAVQAVRELADLAGARCSSEDALLALLGPIESARLEERWKLAVLEGLQTGVSRSGTRPSVGSRLAARLEPFSRLQSTELFAAAWKLAHTLGLPTTAVQRDALARATRDVVQESRPQNERLADLRLLAMADYAEAGASLLTLFQSGREPALREEALAVLRQFKDPQVARDLVAGWRSLAPAVRTPVINLLLQRVAFHEALMNAIETERIKLGELNLDLEQRRRLLRKSTPEIMTRAAQWIGDEEYSNRKKVVEEWLRKLPATGDAGRGRAGFERLCAPCHALGGIGTAVGPDLGALAHRSVEDLLSNILDPNMAMNPAYVSFTAETVSGEIETGILQSESAETIVLLQAMGRRVVLPRKEIKRLESSGLSLMPEGLEAGLSPAELRDLIAFVQQPP